MKYGLFYKYIQHEKRKCIQIVPTTWPVFPLPGVRITDFGLCIYGERFQDI